MLHNLYPILNTAGLGFFPQVVKYKKNDVVVSCTLKNHPQQQCNRKVMEIRTLVIIIMNKNLSATL